MGKLDIRVADLGVPPERIRLTPPPGTATEEDLERAPKPVCELIDGVLVEKAMGTRESLIALFIGIQLADFFHEPHKGAFDAAALVLGPIDVADELLKLGQGDGHAQLRKQFGYFPNNVRNSFSAASFFCLRSACCNTSRPAPLGTERVITGVPSASEST